jgi:hypothetical protein
MGTPKGRVNIAGPSKMQTIKAPDEPQMTGQETTQLVLPNRGGQQISAAWRISAFAEIGLFSENHLTPFHRFR